MALRAFVASSKEGLRYAEAVQKNLDQELQITLWTQGIFAPPRTTLESLLHALDDFDIGIFLLSPDDTTQIRDTTKQTPRDNVIFELGMFVARLGKGRVFLLAPTTSGFHLPTDLAEIQYLTFHDDYSNLESSVGSACSEIKKAIRQMRPTAPALQEYAGLYKDSKYAVIAHCSDPTKFEEFALRSPAGQIVQDLATLAPSSQPRIASVDSRSHVDWSNYLQASPLFVIDSPYYNPYTAWVLRHYQELLIGGSVAFLDESAAGQPVRQAIQADFQVYRSDKSLQPKEMKTFDRYADYVLIMRLPRIVPPTQRQVPPLLLSSRQNGGSMWVVAGIHSKGTYAGATIFSGPAFEALHAKLPPAFRYRPPEFFEAVFRIPREPVIARDLTAAELVHFSELRAQVEVAVADGVPGGIAPCLSGSPSRERILVDTVHVDPVAACNFKCPNCIEKQTRELKLYLSLEALAQIFCDLKQAGCRRIDFYGGEPTLHPNFATLIRMASAMGFSVLIVTNGSRLGHPEVADTLKGMRARHVRVSLDGHSDDAHAHNHGLDREERQFSMIKESVRALLDAGVPVTVSFLLYNNVIADLRAACDFWRKNNATALHLRPVTGRRGESPRLRYSLKDKEVLREVLRDNAGWVVTPPWFAQWLRTGDQPSGAKAYAQCYSAYYRFGISPHDTTPQPTAGAGAGGAQLRETATAWISMCTYRRYDSAFGCAYPEDLATWLRSGRLEVVERIRPDKGDCRAIVCCRDSANQQVLREITGMG